MEAKGIPVRDGEKPYIPPYLQEYYIAFNRLNAKRQYGFGAEQPITLSDIEAYLRLFTTHDTELFVDMIIILDITYIKVQSDGRK